MTLSKGLGGITNDPEATIRTRRALGILSRPELLVTDTGITIDDTGRIALRLNASSGLSQDENGLNFDTTTGITTGGMIDTPPAGFAGYYVQLVIPDTGVGDAWSYFAGDATLEGAGAISNQYGVFVGDLTSGDILNVAFRGEVSAGSGKWNISMTGTASNYFAGSVAIGTETTSAKLNVLSTTEQVRVAYDASNYMKTTVSSSGVASLEATGGFNLINTTGGIKINSGSAIKRLFFGSGSVNVFGGFGAGVDYTDLVISIPGVLPTDTVAMSFTAIPDDNIGNWFAIAETDQVRIRFWTVTLTLFFYLTSVAVTVFGP